MTLATGLYLGSHGWWTESWFHLAIRLDDPHDLLLANDVAVLFVMIVKPPPAARGAIVAAAHRSHLGAPAGG